MNKIAIITFEWKGRNLHQCINDCEILKVCNFEDIENELKLNKHAKWNFFQHGFINYRYLKLDKLFNFSEVCEVLLIDYYMNNKEEYVGFLNILKKFNNKLRKNKLEKIELRKC